jgi:uroporphyrinogen III methyltransferase/synthase
MTKRQRPCGQVILVGAGPGEAELATAAAAKWISRADVIIYDRLIASALLRLSRPDAERIYVGKTPGQPGWEQPAINRLLLQHARAGKLVVRLKGGDPLVFGRGGEEAEALARESIAFRIVPGITAAAAAAAYAGIPLTDRRHAATVAFVTARRAPGGGQDRQGDFRAPAIDWEALAGIDTVVFYMGVGSLDEISANLVRAGRDAETPAAIVEGASTPRQRTVTAPLGQLPVAAQEAGIHPPAVIIVGNAAALREKLAWFEKLPLFGKTVMVTRPWHQATELCERLAELGAAVVEAPAVEIHPVADFAAVDAGLRRLGEFDWVVFTSVNGVQAFVRRCRELGLDGRSLASVKVAAVGPTTAEALREAFIRPDLVPATFTTDALGKAILAAGEARNKRFLLARADIAPPGLTEALRKAGAGVQEVAFYRTVRPEALPEEAVAALRGRGVDWITFTSSSTVSNFLALLGEQATALLEEVKFAAIGPVTARTLREHGLAPHAVAATHTLDGLIDAILQGGA